MCCGDLLFCLFLQLDHVSLGVSSGRQAMRDAIKKFTESPDVRAVQYTCADLDPPDNATAACTFIFAKHLQVHNLKYVLIFSPSIRSCCTPAGNMFAVFASKPLASAAYWLILSAATLALRLPCR